MINLLPPEEKEILRQEKSWKLILILGILSLIFLISFALILFSIKIYLQSQLDFQKTLVKLEEERAKTFGIKNLQSEIAALNQNLSKLNSFYQRQISLTEILEKISKILPPEIYLNNFTYQRNTLQISLSGFAPSRENLLEFKKKLEEEKSFKEVYFPPQNWLKTTNIDFFLTFKINY